VIPLVCSGGACEAILLGIGGLIIGHQLVENSHHNEQNAPPPPPPPSNQPAARPADHPQPAAEPGAQPHDGQAQGDDRRDENRQPSPALEGDPYSPREVDRRRSEWRRQEGAPSNDPDSPIPDRGPGRDQGGHEARGGTPHETGERNVNPN